MTVKELIRELQDVPGDAVVLGDLHPHLYNRIVDGVTYNDATNTISFYGGDLFKFEEENPNILDYDDNMINYQRGRIAAQLGEPFDYNKPLAWRAGYREEIINPSSGE